MKPKVIVIDGKTYNSVEEMPPDVREKYEGIMQSLKDANSNSIPDALEGTSMLSDQDRDGIPDVLENLAATGTVASSLRIIIDGKEYDRIEDLPPEARAKYEEAMGHMDADRNGIPDFVEGMFTSSKPSAVLSSNIEAEAPPRPTSLPASPTAPNATPDTSNGLMLVLVGLLLLVFCAVGAGALWYFFLR